MSQVSKLRVFIILLLLSCDNNDNNNNQRIKNEFEICYGKTIDLELTKKVYELANDTINNWVKHKLKFWAGERLNYSYKIDSILCFNAEKSKMIGAILLKTLERDYKGDGITYLYGVKIKSKWYFFEGPHMVISRKSYQKDEKEPLPFEKLHEIAVEEIFINYLKKNRNTKEWEINDKFFADLTSTAWWLNGVEPANQTEWDKIYKRIIMEKWKHFETTKN